MLSYGFGQLRVVQKKFGFNHFLLFWGFMTLVLVNFQFLLQGIFPQFSLAFMGNLYVVLMFAADIMSLVVIGCVVLAFARRLFFRPYFIDQTGDAFFILSMVGTLMIAYFGQHACEVALGTHEGSIAMPVTWGLSAIFSGADSATLHTLTRVFWWIHAIVLLIFMNYLPYSKHLHVLTAIPNCFFRSTGLVSTVPRLTFKKGEDFGISKVVQFRWSDLLDFMACTECGRCQEVCPASSTDKTLNPKKMIHQGKVNLFTNSKSIFANRPADMLAPAPRDAKMNVPLINGSDRERCYKGYLGLHDLRCLHAGLPGFY